MNLLSASELLQFVEARPGAAWTTGARSQPFSAQVHQGLFTITPEGRDPRTVRVAEIDKLLARLAATGSSRPGDYRAETQNASYLLALVKAWLGDGMPGLPAARIDSDLTLDLPEAQQGDLTRGVYRALMGRGRQGRKLAHGTEVLRVGATRALWFASVYWGANLPGNDVEIAVDLRRLCDPRETPVRLSAWFEYVTQEIGGVPARNHSPKEDTAWFRRGFTLARAEEFFARLGRQINGLLPLPQQWPVGAALPVAASAAPTERPLKTWEWALAAVEALRSPTIAEATAWVLARKPDLETSNIGTDLRMLAVNNAGRYGHSNVRSAHQRGTREYDRLFAADAHFVLYDPAVNGIWELQQRDGSPVLRPVRVDVPADSELAVAQEVAEQDGSFDPGNEEDARDRVVSSVVQRRGQRSFRNALLQAYEGRCAICGTDVSATLEAAHITPFLGEHRNVVTNGLLLRADLHTLFDLGLLWIDDEALTVHIHPTLTGSYYQQFQGQALRTPAEKSDHPSPAAGPTFRKLPEWAISLSLIPVQQSRAFLNKSNSLGTPARVRVA